MCDLVFDDERVEESNGDSFIRFCIERNCGVEEHCDQNTDDNEIISWSDRSGYSV